MPVFDTGIVSQPGLEDFLKKSFYMNMVRMRPAGVLPLTTVLGIHGNGLHSGSPIISNVHTYYTNSQVYPKFTLTAAATNVATTLTVASTTGIIPGMVFQVNTPTTWTTAVPESILVESVPSATTLTVRRQFGSGLATAYTGTESFIKVGSAFEQNSERPESVKFADAAVTNYTSIIRNAWAQSATVAATMRQTGIDNVAQHKSEAAEYHCTDLEEDIIWGQKMSPTLYKNQIVTRSGGILEGIRTGAPGNVTTTTSFNWNTMSAFLDKMYSNSVGSSAGNSRIAITGTGGYNNFIALAKAQGSYQLNGNESVIGIRCENLRFYRVDLTVMESSLFNAKGLGNSVLIVDPSVLKPRPLTGRNTFHTDFGGKNSDGKTVDGLGGVYTTEYTLENLNLSAHGYIPAFTAIS